MFLICDSDADGSDNTGLTWCFGVDERKILCLSQRQVLNMKCLKSDRGPSINQEGPTAASLSARRFNKLVKQNQYIKLFGNIWTLVWLQTAAELGRPTAPYYWLWGAHQSSFWLSLFKKSDWNEEVYAEQKFTLRTSENMQSWGCIFNVSPPMFAGLLLWIQIPNNNARSKSLNIYQNTPKNMEETPGSQRSKK